VVVGCVVPRRSRSWHNPLLVEINDEMIAAERRYIAAASVADLTDNPTELALPAAPRT
jgi:hypothetical protein